MYDKSVNYSWGIVFVWFVRPLGGEGCIDRIEIFKNVSVVISLMCLCMIGIMIPATHAPMRIIFAL